jgi:hypothetical protein
MKDLIMLKRAERAAWERLCETIRVVADTKHDFYYSTKRREPPPEFLVSNAAIAESFQMWLSFAQALREEAEKPRELRAKREV